jgi:hypothetical protein
MARNKLSDLNNHLFEQLERLNDQELSPENLDKEIKRAKSMGEIASNIIEVNKISLEAIKMIAKGDIDKRDIPNEFDTVKQIEGL